MTVSTWSGTRSNQSSSSARVVIVPVGLLGVAMNASFVRGVIASSMASRSKRCSRSGTRTGTAPSLSGSSTKLTNDGQPVTTSSPGSSMAWQTYPITASAPAQTVTSLEPDVVLLGERERRRKHPPSG